MSKMDSDSASERHDIAIIGGGMAGTTLAIGLARLGLRVAVIDRDKPQALSDAAFDGRASAIALGSQELFDRLGLWADLEPDAGPILDIRVSDGPSRLFLHYDHRAVGDKPFGWIVENHRLRGRIWEAALAESGVTALTGRTVASVATSVTEATVTLTDGTIVSSALVLGCDGRASLARKAAGISALSDSYEQTALVFAVRHDEPHRGVAHERFLPGGPFAVLPLADPHRSSIVWTEKNELADRLMGLSDASLAAEMLARFGDCLGRIIPEGKRWRWPLAVHLAERFTGQRLALVGDAAHGIHPIAGQGLNLGLRDVAALIDLMAEAMRIGRDIGDPGILAAYESARRADVTAMVAATDGLNRLFSNGSPLLRSARSLGLAAVERMPGLKGLFMRQAMGIRG
jgi:2-octaprenyl-6-methoxyphenol hydroxylase